MSKRKVCVGCQHDRTKNIFYCNDIKEIIDIKRCLQIRKRKQKENSLKGEKVKKCP